MNKYFVIVLLLLVSFIFLNPLKNLSKEYSDFATPSELIERNQVLSMPWQKLNGPFGGQGYTIRFSPDNSNKIIVTDSFAGIHISNDKGLTWEESIQGIDARTGKSGDSVPVFVTTIDPNDPKRIWCGVKNAMGVFLSIDGGMTWQHKDNGLPSGEDVEIRGLAVKPNDSKTIFAAGDLEEIGPFMGAFQRTKGIVYKTTDGGENWTQVLSGGNLFKDIIIDPNNTNTVYIASGFFDRHQLEKLEGVYKSTDGGNTWTQINSGIRNLYVSTLKFDPKNPNILWGTTGMIRQFVNDFENEDGSIIVSRDNGMTWTEAKRGRNNGGTQVYSALGISPTNSSTIYASGFGLFTKSIDGGMTWVEAGFGPRGSNAGHPIDITVDPNDDNTVFVDSYVGGVFKSTDGGQTWVSNAFGYSGAETRGVAISPGGENIFATSRSGIFLSQDKGINWVPVGVGDVAFDELQALAPHPIDKNKILLGDSQNAMSSIFLSNDGGMSWKTVFMLFKENFSQNPSSADLDGEISFVDIKWAKSNPNTAYAACVKKSLFHDSVDSIGWGIFKSSDGGMTWANKQNGIPGFKNTWSLDVDPNNENIIYAATNDTGIIKSTDGGENWIQINNGLQGINSFHSVSICPANTQVILAGSSDGRIFRSSDAGATWQTGSSDIRPGDNIVSIVFNPTVAPQAFAASDFTGFYISNDAGLTWQQFNDGLSMREVHNLAVTPDGSAVYAATNGGGVFRLPINGGSLVLSRTQTETPSNAGIDAINNKNPVGSGFKPDPTGGSTSSSSGSLKQNEFSLSVTGPGLDGVMLSEKKPAMTFLNIAFDQSLFTNELLDSKVEINNNLQPDKAAKALNIRPRSFLLTARDSSKKIEMVVPFLKKLRKIFGGQVPVFFRVTVTQTTQGMSFSKDFEIPVIVRD